LAIANKRHDVVAVTLNDPREREMPDCGMVVLEDAENGGQVIIDTSDDDLRGQYQRTALSRFARRNRIFRASGVDHVDVATDTPYVTELVKFFAKRKRHFR